MWRDAGRMTAVAAWLASPRGRPRLRIRQSQRHPTPVGSHGIEAIGAEDLRMEDDPVTTGRPGRLEGRKGRRGQSDEATSVIVDTPYCGTLVVVAGESQTGAIGRPRGPHAI